uniref:Zinc finger protein n=2 Tax=Loa loa TaxID=7209 RepID=A0A1I7VXU6_LOALO
MRIKCRFCNVTVQTRKEYLKHLDMDKKYSFTCPECGKTFYSPKRFQHHEDVHQPKSQCEICNSSFSYTTTLQQHKRLKHGITDMEKYECPHVDCNATMQGKIKYNEHFQMHDKSFRYQCKHTGCGKEFHISSSLSMHKKYCKHKSQIGQMRIKCRFCNVTVQTRKEYLKHLDMDKKYSFTCPECGKTFYSPKRFQHHEDVHQPKSQCEICNSSFSYTTTLQQHKRLKHGITDMEKYECPHVDCNATMQGKIKYNEHFQMHDKPFRYQCKHTGCGKNSTFRHHFPCTQKSCKRKPQ